MIDKSHLLFFLQLLDSYDNFCYCNLRIASDQITQCNAESFSGGKGSLIFVSCFSISCAIHAKSSSKTVGDFRKYLKKKMSSCNHQSSLTFFFFEVMYIACDVDSIFPINEAACFKRRLMFLCWFAGLAWLFHLGLF